MKNELLREYYSEYLKVKRMVKEGSIPGRARKEALENIYSLYYDAQNEQLPISEVHEGTAEEFASEILKSLPGREIMKRWQAAALAVIVLLAVGTVLYFTSDSYLAVKQGFAYVLNNFERYTIEPTETIPFTKREGRGARYEVQYIDGRAEVLEGHDKYDYKSFENFVFDESGEKITLEVKIPYARRSALISSIDLPVAFYCSSDGEELCFYQSIIKLEAEESLYYGFFDYFRTEKNGDIYLGFEFLLKEGGSAEEYILSGDSFFIDFGNIYEVTWVNHLEGFEYDYLTTQEVYEEVNVFPFFHFAKAETRDFPNGYRAEAQVTKTSESGRFTVTAYLNVDFDPEKFWNIGYIHENNFEDTAEFYVDSGDFGITEGGKKAYVEVRYRIEGSDEWLTERIEYTFDDIK